MQLTKPVERLSQNGRDFAPDIASSSLAEEGSGHSVFGFLHVASLEAVSPALNWRSLAHRHGEFDQLVVIMHGSCTFIHDGHQSCATAPACIYTPANVVHQFRYTSNTRGFVVSASSDFIAGLPSSHGAATNAVMRLATHRIVALPKETAAKAVSQVADLLREKQKSGHRYRFDVMRYLFGVLLLEIDGAIEVTRGKTPAVVLEDEADLFRRFRNLLQETIGGVGIAPDVPTAAACTVEAFAKQLSVTRYRLNAVCEKVRGTPTRDVVRMAILQQAARLLLYTCKPVKEISFLLGYSHASHFSRFFKQRQGVTPETFRASGGSVRLLPTPAPDGPLPIRIVTRNGKEAIWREQ